MTVSYKSENGIGQFTIDNGRLNLWTMAMHEQLYRQYLQFLNDDSVKVGVIAGAGENFSAGDDLKESDTPLKSRDNPRWDELTLQHRRTKPIIAAIDGYCLGQGAIYALLLCDIRVAGTSLTMGFPEIAYGMGGISSATRLGLIIPPIHAAYLALTGEKFGADNALRYNLINQVVSSESVLDTAMEIAGKIARHPMVAIKTELDALHRGTELSRSDALDYARAQYVAQRNIYIAEGNSAMSSLKSTQGESK